MVICNKELIQTMESNDDDMNEIDSDFDEIKCQNLNPDADILDFRTEMDQLSFYEKTDFRQYCVIFDGTYLGAFFCCAKSWHGIRWSFYI